MPTKPYGQLNTTNIRKFPIEHANSLRFRAKYNKKKRP